MKKSEKYEILCNLFYDLWADSEFNKYFQSVLPDTYNFLKIIKTEPFSFLKHAFSDEELKVLKRFSTRYFKKTLDK